MAAYTIVDQEQVQAQDATGAYVPSVRVTFTVDGQGPFSVDVARSAFSAEKVDEVITQYVGHIRDVANLGKS